MRVLLISIVLLTFSAITHAEPSIKVKPYLETRNKAEVKLSDICEFQGVAESVRKDIGKVVLGDAPLLGERRIFTSQSLSQVFRRHLTQKNIKVVIPNQVIVENQGHKLNEQEITKQLVDHWTPICGECKFRFVSLVMPLVPQDLSGHPWRIVPGPQVPRGNFSVQLRISDATTKQRIFWVNGRVETHRKVPVLKVSKRSRERVQASDIRFEFRDVTHNMRAVLNAEQIVNLQVTRAMRAGEALWDHLLIRERALRRGDTVKVVIGAESYQLAVTGVAEEDGFVGDMVKVKNPTSKRVLVGRVIARGKVRVE